jgi:hypothetical protein
VLALRDLAEGEVVFEILGPTVATPSRYSVQIGEDLHVDVGSAGRLEHFPWRFLNHGCEPNVVVRGRAVVALRAVAKFEELVFDYNTTELDLASPFVCGCGSDRCYGLVRGFRHLERAARERLRGMLAPHLLRRLDGDLAGSS